MSKLLLAFAIVLAFASLGFCQVAADKIVNLPGLSPQQNGTLNMYSGYISLPNGRNYFYWYEK